MKTTWQLNRRSFFVLLLAITFVLAACGSGGGSPTAMGGGAGSGLCANDLFPVVLGATWTYSGTGPTGEFTWTSTITDVSGSGFTLTNQFDELTATQQWSCTAEGLAALAYGGGPEASLNTSGMSGTFETTDTAGVTFPLHISAGDTWTQTFTIHGDMGLTGAGQAATADGTVSQGYTAIGIESVTVPAGTFNAMKIEAALHFDLQVVLEGGVTAPLAFDLVTTNWWVAGVGWVKSDSATSGDAGDIGAGTSELVSFSIP